MKIAVLFDTYLNNRMGLFNAIVNRTKSLVDVSDCTIHMYCLQARPSGLNRLIRRLPNQSYDDILYTEGLTFHIMWYKRYLLDDVLANKFHRPPFLFRRWAKRNISVFSSYDIVTAHSTRCGEMARLINKKYGIPYFVTWHGTDIHTTPFLSSSLRCYVTTILQAAACNFFVSEALRDIAYSFATNFKSEILYNGVSDSFMRFDEKKREELRGRYGVGSNKVVAFVGNVIPVKNVMILPQIFKEVKKEIPNHLLFWIVGDGLHKAIVEEEMKKRNVECVFLGNRPLSEMPDLMNCIDVLVLPSKNESFGLVLVEAMACGAKAVGSRVGGIPEVIGEENTFEIDDEFVQNISRRIVYLLMNEVRQEVKKEFNWKETALKEYRIYCGFLQNREKDEQVII